MTIPEGWMLQEQEVQQLAQERIEALLAGRRVDTLEEFVLRHILRTRVIQPVIDKLLRENDAD